MHLSVMIIPIVPHEPERAFDDDRGNRRSG